MAAQLIQSSEVAPSTGWPWGGVVFALSRLRPDDAREQTCVLTALEGSTRSVSSHRRQWRTGASRTCSSTSCVRSGSGCMAALPRDLACQEEQS